MEGTKVVNNDTAIEDAKLVNSDTTMEDTKLVNNDTAMEDTKSVNSDTFSYESDSPDIFPSSSDEDDPETDAKEEFMSEDESSANKDTVIVHDAVQSILGAIAHESDLIQNYVCKDAVKKTESQEKLEDGEETTEKKVIDHETFIESLKLHPKEKKKKKVTIRKQSISESNKMEMEKPKSEGKEKRGGRASAATVFIYKARRKLKLTEGSRVNYTDKDRAAACTAGAKDLKANLKRSKSGDVMGGIVDDSDFFEVSSQGLREAKYGELRLATIMLTKALELESDNVPCLVARSRCHLQLGNPTAALSDVNEALQIDSTSIRAIQQKAEVLYCVGRFEESLVFFQRGLRYRPDMECFRLGVQKSQQAIQNTIGSPDSKELNDIESTLQEMNVKEPLKEAGNRNSSRSALGQISKDRIFLTHLLHNPALRAGEERELSERVRVCAEEGLSFLLAREEFWIQQQPGRKRRVRKTPANKSKPSELQRSRAASCTKFSKIRRIQAQLERILKDMEEGIEKGEYEEGLTLGLEGFAVIREAGTTPPMSLIMLEPKLYFLMGKIQHSLDNYEDAMDSMLKGLDMAREYQQMELEGNIRRSIGRVHATAGRHDEAIGAWEELIPHVRTAEERAAIFRDIGECYRAVDRHETARYFGLKSLNEAECCRDGMQVILANILLGEVEVKIGNSESGIRRLSLAMKMSEDKGELELTRRASDLLQTHPLPD